MNFNYSDNDEDPLAEFDTHDIKEDIFKDSLDLEQHYYDLGYQEGINSSNPDANHDGELLGIQTGFQKFVFVGAIMEFSKDLRLITDIHIQNGDTVDSQGKQRNYQRINTQLISLLNTLNDVFINTEGELHVDNTPDSIELYDKTIKHARGKLITISTQLNELQTFTKLEKLCQMAIGKSPENKLTGDDMDMW